jgi:hypothetical protein
MSRFSPSDAALEGFRLARAHPGTILAWCFIYLGGLFLISIAMIATLGPKFIEMARKGQLVTAQQDPAQLADTLSSSWPALIVVVIMTLLLMSMIMGGIFRLVLRPAEHGFAHLRLGKDELRLAVVNLALVAIGIFFLALGVLLTSIVSRSGPFAVAIVSIVFVAFTVWIGVRLALLTPMAFDHGKIEFRAAWNLSRDHFWSLLGMVLMAVIFYLIVWVLMSVASIVLVELSGGEQAMKDVSMLTPLTALAAALSLVMQMLLQILQIMMIYGPFAVAYRQITAEPEKDAFA